VGIDPLKSIALLESFRSVPYRQQTVEEKNGIIFINDTTSTTPTATIKALEAFSDKPIILILGGNSKNLPTNVLINRLIDAGKIILLKGSFTDEIIPQLKLMYANITSGPYDNLEKAIKKAYEEAVKILKGGKQKVYILFSPGATSFAMFNNEFHRGDEFNRIVNTLK
jgi:UDP-N-acetylmuramoylalanine--D-glutamate ligase